MSELDDRLRDILQSNASGSCSVECERGINGYEEDIAQIKQAFSEELGLTKLMQDMANMHANMKHDALRLGLSHSGEKYLSGQEWYDGFKQEINKGLLDKSSDFLSTPGYLNTEAVSDAAKRASGLDS